MANIQPQLRLYTNDGFQLTFSNGWTVSVMFGPGSYSEHRHEVRGQSLKSEHCSKKRRRVYLGCDWGSSPAVM